MAVVAVLAMAWMAVLAMDGLAVVASTVLVMGGVPFLFYLLRSQRELDPEFDQPGGRPFVDGIGVSGRRR